MLDCKLAKGREIVLASSGESAVELSARWMGNEVAGFTNAIDKVNIHDDCSVVPWARICRAPGCCSNCHIIQSPDTIDQEFP